MRCANCGQKYAKVDTCPACGSNIVDVRSYDEVELSVEAKAMREAWQDERLVGFIESDAEEQTSAANAQDDGTVSFVASGRPVHGEGDTIRIGKLLAQAMNADDEQWIVEDASRIGAADFVLRDLNSTRRLEVQVVRSMVKGEQYRRLRNGEAITEKSVDPSEVAKEIKEAVEKKVDHLRSAARGMVLALDASRFSVHVLSSVTEAYRREFGSWTDSLGFSQVWLVGPTDSTSQRLDS